MNRPPYTLAPSPLRRIPLPELPTTALAEKPSGFGSLTDRAYHATPALHYSLLKHYRYSADAGLFTSWQEDTITHAMKFGSLVHVLALNPENLGERHRIEDKRIAVKKDGTPYANGQQDKEQAAEWEQAEQSGTYIISTADAAVAESIASSATRCINEIYPDFSWYTEAAAWATIGEEKYKCKFDALAEHLGSEFAVDIKTTAADVTNERAVVRDFYAYGYHIQAALYNHILRTVTGRSLAEFAFIFVSKSAPYIARPLILQEQHIARFTDSDLTEAIANYRRTLAPDYSPTYTLPPITLNPETI